MGRSLIDAAVEVKREEGRPKTFLQPEGLFGLVPPEWKVFLLGYGGNDCWSPEKPIRGLPSREFRSDWTWNLIESYEKYNEEEISRHFTYYTLKELEKIDLSEPLGLPDDPEKPQDFNHCISVKARKDGEWKDLRSFHHLTVEKILEGLEVQGATDAEDMELEASEIKVERRKKSFYADGFEKFLATINRIFSNEAFNFEHAPHEEVKKEDIRLVVAADISELE